METFHQSSVLVMSLMVEKIQRYIVQHEVHVICITEMSVHERSDAFLSLDGKRWAGGQFAGEKGMCIDC